LTKEQILDLGKKDLTAGLNKLGDEGWELVTVDPARPAPGAGLPAKPAEYYFKRPRNVLPERLEDVKRRVVLAEWDLDWAKQDAASAKLMARKGFVSQNEVKAAEQRLQLAEMALEQALQDLKAFSAESKETPTKERKPEK
jgi:hypothetical protein